MFDTARSFTRSVRDAFNYVTDHRYREFHFQRKIVGPHRRERAATKLVGEAAANGPLAEEGLVEFGRIMDADAIRDVRDYIAPLPARDIYRPEFGTFAAPNNVPAATHVAYYDDATTLNAPHLLAIANRPEILAEARAFLGAPPTIAALSLWWSLPTADGSAEHTQLFHRDVDDLRFLKLFVYLTDVDEDSGPHVYAAGSHRMNALTRIVRYPEERVQLACGRNAIRHITGPAGTAFLSATYGLHRGLPPKVRPRLVFQALYATRPLIYSPKRPLRNAIGTELGLDQYVNRCLLRF